MEYNSSQVRSPGPEEVEAGNIILFRRYGSYKAIPFNPTAVSESSTSSTPMSISTPTITSASSSTVIPIAFLLNPSTPSPPSSLLTALGRPNASPVSSGSSLTTSFTPINAPPSLDSSSSSLAAPTLLVESEENKGGDGETPPTPTKLLAYLRQKKPRPAVRSALSMLTHPSQNLYLPTSAKACKECKMRGLECVTLPERKSCAFCATQNGPCSTREERRSGMGQWWGGVSQAERAAKRKALDGREEEEEKEKEKEDKLEMGEGENEGETQPIPTQLLAYLRTRKNSCHLRKAKSMFSHPGRRVHLSTSPEACIQCQEKGFECVTRPTRTHCAYCTLHGSRGQYVCSTGHRRRMYKRNETGPMQENRREEGSRDEALVDEEDLMEVEVEEEEKDGKKENSCGEGESPPTPCFVSTPTTVVTPVSANPFLGSSASSLAAPRLLANLQSRNHFPHVQRAEAMLTHPDREVFLPTSSRACTQCQRKGFECVILPFRKHCTCCTSHGGSQASLCSTREERSNGVGSGYRAGMGNEIPNLLAYFRGRNPGRMVRSAEPMLTNPRREVHPPTSAEACNNCSRYGMECLTLPERKLCAFCVLRSSFSRRYIPCSTQSERGTRAGKRSAGDEMEVDGRESKDEMDVEGVDEVDVDEVEEADEMEVDTDVEEMESGKFGVRPF